MAEEALVAARKKRRRRRLEKLEIPEDHLMLTNEFLGKGGFGVVYLADFNGRNAAAKVVEIEHDLGDNGDAERTDVCEGETRVPH